MDGTCQNVAVGGEVLAWKPTEHCGGHHRGVFGRSSGFSTNLVGMVLVVVANAITIRESIFLIKSNVYLLIGSLKVLSRASMIY